MKLKYRIKEHKFLIYDSEERNDLMFFVAQYKIMGLWLNINDRGIGRFSLPSTCFCETWTSAMNRIKSHKKNMVRASFWWTLRSTDTYYLENGKEDDGYV